MDEGNMDALHKASAILACSGMCRSRRNGGLRGNAHSGRRLRAIIREAGDLHRRLLEGAPGRCSACRSLSGGV